MKKFVVGDWLGRASLSLALAIGVAAAPASAQVAPPREPFGHDGGGRGFGVGLILLPLLGGAIAISAANAGKGEAPPPLSSEPPPRRPPPRAAPHLTTRVSPPPPGETRFRPSELLVEISSAAPPAAVAAVLRRHRLVEAEAASIGLIGVSVRLWRIPDARPVAAVERELAGEAALASVQPNYVYAIQDDAAPPADAPPAPPQYALAKLNVDAALTAAASEPVRVAVIDTAIDDSHPDLIGAVEARFDAIGGATPPRAFDHGTAIAGAIAARGRLKGVDPNARILSARAFDSDGAGEFGATFALLKAIDWAARERAKVVNMSFAGPPDPALNDIVAAALAKGVTLVAAAGNAGPKSPPLYPAADQGVLAVTATDADDKRYEKANLGRYIAVAAPGVDVLLPAPEGGYALQTGTSVSAALVSGVAALMLSRRPEARPADVRKWLTATAAPLGGGVRQNEFGAGLVDARRAADAATAK